MSPLTGYDLPGNSTVAASTTVTATTPEPFVPGGATRRYMMLEERNLAEVVREFLVTHYELDTPGEQIVDRLGNAGLVFVPLGVKDARNADHAYRQVFKERFGDDAGALDLVAIAEKMWNPTPVSSAPAKNTVKVGR